MKRPLLPLIDIWLPRFFLFASASSLPSCCDLLDLFNELWLLWYTWVWLAMLSNQVIEVMHWLFFLFCIIFITVGNGNCDVACLLCKFNLRWCSNRFDKKTFAFASIDKNHYFERRNLCLKRERLSRILDSIYCIIFFFHLKTWLSNYLVWIRHAWIMQWILMYSVESLERKYLAV